MKSALMLALLAAGSVGAAPISDATLFGVAIDRSIDSYPTCNTPEGQQKICVHPERDPKAKTRFVELRPQKPAYLTSNLWVGTRPDGTINFVTVQTGGAKYQAELFDMLTTRYGKPSTINRSIVQNAFGAAFEKIEASWKLNGGALIFRGVDTRLDEGSIGLAADRP